MRPNLGKDLPPAITAAIDSLLDLTSERLAALVGSLNEVPPGESPNRVARLIVVEAGTGEAESLIRRLITFAISSRNLITTFDCQSVEVAEVLASTYGANNKTKIAVEEIQSRILQLIDSRYVTLRAKIATLSNSADKLIDNTKILTDLRPVFPNDGTTDEVVGMIIMNTIRIDFAGKDVQPLFMSIAPEKLIDMKEEIDRAIKKNESLKGFVASSEFENFTSGTDHEN